MAQWRSQQRKPRSYADDVLARIDALRDRFVVQQFEQIAYASESYALLALRSTHWNPALACALITGGVHGYETSGVHGALRFLQTKAQRYAGGV